MVTSDAQPGVLFKALEGQTRTLLENLTAAISNFELLMRLAVVFLFDAPYFGGGFHN